MNLKSQEYHPSDAADRFIAFAPDIQTDFRAAAGLKPAPTSGNHVRRLYARELIHVLKDHGLAAAGKHIGAWPLFRPAIAFWSPRLQPWRPAGRRLGWPEP
jgi:hypothetical protein